ncbi:MAG: EI24 domain-containing protein [Paracoccaceae bacterium]
MGIVLAAFVRALGQLGDPVFRRVLLQGVALSVALLAGVSYAFITLVQVFVPDTVTLPWIGAIGGVETVVGIGTLALVTLLSVFLMVPVAALFCGFLLEDVVTAVERRHYPTLSGADAVPLTDSLKDAVNFLGVMVGMNLLALLVYPFVIPLAPFLFWGLNGWLLGREYFTLVAMRRLGRDGARALRRANGGTIWLAGAMMAAPLSLPFVNLLVPVIGAATFTHLFHRLKGANRG